MRLADRGGERGVPRAFPDQLAQPLASHGGSVEALTAVRHLEEEVAENGRLAFPLQMDQSAGP